MTPGTTTPAPTPITRRKSSAGRVLLPWQEAWRRDASPMKIWEKSRRIGATYTEANDVVMSRLTGERDHDYWFSSADESAAAEFADYCRFWLQTADAVVDAYTDAIEDPQTRRVATAFCVRFPAGPSGVARKMTAMSSNPRRFRSKGGDVGLDEFAYHDAPSEMYRAAEPSTMWGGRLRILSTHNGEGSEFNRFCEMGRRHQRGEPRKGDIPFSLHRITILEAVEQGLVERINESKGTSFTRDQFLAERRARCRDEDHWRQEYLAIPAVDSAAWLTYELIEGCEHDLAGRTDQFGDGPRYLGMDVGETKDRTVIWTLERVGDVLWTREILVFTDEPLRVKEQALLERLRHPNVVRACIDATGVGAQIAQAAELLGRGEAIKFTLPVKDQLAAPLRGRFEDRSIRVPAGDAALREDLHSIRMTRTASGNPRYDAEAGEHGHADRFWAMALAVHATSIDACHAGVMPL